MRNRLVVLFIALVLVVLAVFALRHRARSGRAEEARASSAQTTSPGGTQAGDTVSHPRRQRKGILAEILDHGLTPERAKVFFSMVVGPLPGVTVPPESADPTDFDGTLAIIYLHQVWDSLTPEQRAAAERLIYPHPSSSTKAGSFGAVGRPDLPLLMASAVLGGPFTPAYDFQYRANETNGFLSLQLGDISPIEKVTVVVDNDPPPVLKPPYQGVEIAHTWSWAPDDSPDPRGCVISIHNQAILGWRPEDAQAVVTHEMMHCFQERQAGSVAEMAKLNAWVLEGEATWAAFTTEPDIVNDGTGMTATWRAYSFFPQTLYVNRSYDAVGVFGHLSDLAGDGVVWSRLLPVVQADMGTSDPLNVLIQGYETDYYTNWGSSYWRVPAHKLWNMLGPGKLPDDFPNSQDISVGPEFVDQLTAGSDLSAMYELKGSADIITVGLMTGYGRLADSGFKLDTALDSSAPLILCVKEGGCKCPDGSDGASLFTKKATAPLFMGINGGDTTAQVGVVGDSLDHYCKHPDPPPPPDGRGGGGGGGGGGSGDNTPPKKQPPPPPDGRTWGDPHVETFDKLGYDFQVTGEYTLARSTKDDFLVQVRQVPVLGPKFASVNQAVATRIGGQRLTFTMENSALVLRIDGQEIQGDPPRLKGGSLTGATTSYGGAYGLTWPDGTTLHVQQLGSYAIDVKVRPAPSRKGTLAGLLGDFDGNPDNDLVGKNNARLTLSKEDLNQKLASAWRVTKPNSLFDYKPGQSPETFYDPNFPAKDADAARLTNYGSAESTCRAHGITDQRLLNDCILDLAVTNSFVFGSKYGHEQQVLAARAAIAHPAAPTLPILWDSGEILDSKSEPEFKFDGKAGDVVWIGKDKSCSDRIDQDHHTVYLTLYDPNGKRVEGTGTGCDFGRSVLPTTGTYSLRSVFKYRNEIVRYRIPVKFVRPDRHQQIAYGQMVSGNIEQWAAHDVYTWTGQAGDLIVLSGSGCDLNFFTAIIDGDGHEILGPSCRIGTYWKVPKDGTYQLVVNNSEWAHAETTGPYHFVFQGGKLAVPQ